MSVIPIAMPEKTQKQNTEKNTQDTITEMYPDMVMEKITLAEGRIESLFDLLHKLIENPYKIKSVDRLMDFSIKFKNKIEIPQFITQIIFDTEKNEQLSITGFELKGSMVYFEYEINHVDNYKYYMDFGADKLIVKDYVLFKYVFEHINDNDLSAILNTLSDIIMEVDTERKYIIETLRNGNVKIEN